MGCLHRASRLCAAPWAPQPQVTGIACSAPRTFAWGAAGVCGNSPPSGTDRAPGLISAQPRFALFGLGAWAPLPCGRRGRLCGAGTQPGDHREEKASRFLEETERRRGGAAAGPEARARETRRAPVRGRGPASASAPRASAGRCGKAGPELRELQRESGTASEAWLVLGYLGSWEDESLGSRSCKRKMGLVGAASAS